jgi:SH3-like domain-containing protein
MIDSYKNYFFFLFFLFSVLLFVSTSFADENAFFLSLKKNEVNLRQGPSFKYPIILTYKKKYLPIVVLDKSETWRKVKDFENNSGWIHISQLSKRKSAINIKANSILFKRSTIYSKPIAKLETGRLVLVEKCKIKWCKINSDDITGWMLKKYLWGTTN